MDEVIILMLLIVALMLINHYIDLGRSFKIGLFIVQLIILAVQIYVVFK